jgi:DNA-binding LytR/AlgR family response regulator
MSLRVVLADDEDLARRRLSRMLREAGCEVVAELSGSREVLEWFQGEHTADALFLDIQMPGLTGLEVIAELKAPPPVVFVTAHVQYALQAFEAAAVDYLLKPVQEDRLQKTLQRLHHKLVPRRSGTELASLLPQPAATPQRFPAKAGEGFVFLELRKVSHFEVDTEVVYALAGTDRYRTSWTTLAEVETAFPDAGMLRIQRHLLIRPEMVMGFKPTWGGRGQVRLQGGQELDVSRKATPVLKAKLGLA